MKRTAQKDLDFCSPEDLLAVRNDATPGVPIDAITTACERAMAVLYLLSGQFTGDASDRYADHIIAGVIWDVQGTIEQIRTLAAYGNATSTPDTRKRGDQ
ncbi:hypothetical protein R4K01_12940 [Pseudomonas aeruginosa]|uniref:DUF3077 domain-containing protein n=1 Tax=Pseudomonas aeruginosa TaxID=287 RepID=A0ABD7KA84_PSEAI|nr:MULTISPECIES: hypothetical protein [Pseudomonas aeruginosa group]KFF32689.1 hypothetical protein G039_0328790 [Pseudomonas aeruginosa VRFPA01]MBG4707717.1 hypothetical protein [Pseudomonas aeruginosa]MBG5227051.1 hypothetical protein [Pseudomonas aeruginosa]MBH8769397.1 hypothetical protein [Pseudomonas aeruginosa]MBH9130809.1 hypothetical protein [Pseudomonas aeruginosa]